MGGTTLLGVSRRISLNASVWTQFIREKLLDANLVKINMSRSPTQTESQQIIVRDYLMQIFMSTINFSISSVF